jgi:catechol 2,3-dioxygenase-like lactoylglutathione lyase family enzyme
MDARLIGTELYFSDLERAREFYTSVLGLKISDEQPGHHARFDLGAAFLCLERKGSESYPSQDKAVLFFEVADLRAAIGELGEQRIVQHEATWAVLHDPEGHNILLLQK